MKTLIVCGLVICLLSAGCTTLRPITNEPSDLPHQIVDTGAVRPGDRVVIGSVDGVKHQFVVQSVHDGAIYGAQDSVAFSDIAFIKLRKFSVAKTTLLVVFGVLAVAAIAVAASDPVPNIHLQ
jgi:hypothetical protein